MPKSRIGAFALAVWLLLCAGLSRSALCADPEAIPKERAEILVESMRGSLEQWEHDVAFTSTFVFRQGSAAGHVDIDSGECEAVTVKKTMTGEYHKWGPRERLRVEPETPPTLVGSAEQISAAGTITLRGPQGVDLLTDGTTTIEYTPKIVGVAGLPDDVQFAGKAVIQPSDPDRSFRTEAAAAEMLVTPLSTYGTLAPGQLFDSKGFVTPVAPGEVVERVYEHGEDQLEVVRETATQSLSLRLWTLPFPPVLKSVVARSTPSNGPQYEYRAVLSDFQDCPGGMVARTVVSTSGSEGNKIYFRDWRSPDLGDAPPEARHFEISVPDDTTIGGITLLPPIDDGKRLLSLDAIEEEHVAELPLSTKDVVDPSAPPEPPIPGQDAGQRFWLFVGFNAVCVVLLLVYLRWRRRVRGTRPG